MISVILPIYRVEKYIRACIKSVLCQTYRDFEMILVDDGSPDDSAKLAEELLQEDGSVPYKMIHTENRGVSAARNTGMDNAAGEYVIMVDSDDVVCPTFLQDFMQMIRDYPGGDIYSAGFSVVDEHSFQTFDRGEGKINDLSREQAQIEFFHRTIRFLLPTLLLKRSFLEENHIRFDESVRYSEDVQFIWRCLAYNQKRVIHDIRRNYNYILHPGSTMTASGIPKILTCCTGIDSLMRQAKPMLCDQIREQMEPRLYFSMMHGAAKILDAKGFSRLYKEACVGPYIRKQAQSGGMKVRVTALALLISKRMGYKIMRKF